MKYIAILIALIVAILGWTYQVQHDANIAIVWTGLVHTAALFGSLLAGLLSFVLKVAGALLVMAALLLITRKGLRLARR